MLRVSHPLCRWKADGIELPVTAPSDAVEALRIIFPAARQQPGRVESHRRQPELSAAATMPRRGGETASVERMELWTWSLVAVGICLLLYAAFVAALVIAGRHESARALAGFVPDCIVLCSRLLRDPRVPRRKRALIVALTGYLALPFDLVPDFIPIAGQLDDVVIVALVLRSLLRSGGESLIREQWPGPDNSLALVLRLAA